MLAAGTTVRSPRGTVVEILESTPARFRLRRELPPGTGRTPPHRHLDGSERFELLEGEAIGMLGRRRRLMRPGDVLEVPRGAVHVHPHTARGARAVVEHTIEPRVRFVEVFFDSWLRWLSEGRVDSQDEPRLLGVMAVLRDGGGGTWVAGPPVAAQQALAKALAPIAARRGYRAVM